MSNVAYLIVAHRQPAQIERQVRTLTAAGDSVALVHLDRRAGPQIEVDLRRRLADLEAVHFVPRRRVWWGRFSGVAANLDGLRTIERLGLDPAQTVLMSGQDYPIKPPAMIESFLGSRADEAFMDHFPLPNNDLWPYQRGGFDRIDYFHTWVPRRGPTRLPVRRVSPLRLTPHGGSALLALGRDHRRYVTRFAATDRHTVRYFRWVGNPDELFFQTILMNSPLRDRVVNDNLFEIGWEPHANHPKVLTEGDLPALAESKSLFARKFDLATDPGILDAVDAELLV